VLYLTGACFDFCFCCFAEVLFGGGDWLPDVSAAGGGGYLTLLPPVTFWFWHEVSKEMTMAQAATAAVARA